MVLKTAVRRIGVSGASGMVGRHVLALLARHGIACAATSRTAPSMACAWQPSDLREWTTPDQLDQVFPDVDAVFHVGAAVPVVGPLAAPVLMDANVRATLVLGQWALARGKPVVFLSGAAVYGDGAGVAHESDPVSAMPAGGLYGLSKALGEQVLTYCAAQGLALTILRATAIYGWGLAETKTVPGFLARAHAGQAITLQPPADDRVDMVHAADVAAALLAALNAGARGVFNIGGPALVSFRELAETCCAVAGAGTVTVAPDPASRSPADRFAVDMSAAARAFGYAPRVGLSQGLTMLDRRQLLPDGEGARP